MTSHKVGLSGKSLVDGKYANGEKVIFYVEGVVKAEPHFVQTASGGQVSEMTVTVGDLLAPTTKKEFNEMAERFAAVRAAREDDGQEPLL